jgi:hypothetical protein
MICAVFLRVCCGKPGIVAEHSNRGGDRDIACLAYSMLSGSKACDVLVTLLIHTGFNICCCIQFFLKVLTRLRDRKGEGVGAGKDSFARTLVCPRRNGEDVEMFK